jgi:phosphatidate cytidylyltransferase
MLRQRITTAVLGVIVVLAVLVWGALPWKTLVYIGTLLAVIEFAGLVRLRWYSPATIWALLVATVIMWRPELITVLNLQIAVAVTLLIPVAVKNKTTFLQSSSNFIGVLYLGFGGASLANLRILSDGTAWVLLYLFVIWFTDTFAFFIGSRLQGPKLWPSISPNKTLTGAAGGIIGGALGGLVIGGSLLSFPIWVYVVIGMCISVIGQLGDLVESAYKRAAGVKDSGRLLPGHGGMLDRVDSLLFAAPFALHLIIFAIHYWQG